MLSEELKKSGYVEGHLISGDRILWIEGGISTDIHDKLYERHMMEPSERYGEVLAKGVFQYGGQYGHLGARLVWLTTALALRKKTRNEYSKFLLGHQLNPMARKRAPG